MEKMYLRKYLIIFTIIILIGSIIIPGLSKDIKNNYLDSIKKEDNIEYVTGEFIVKFKLDKDIVITKSANGISLTGISSIDKLNKDYGVKSIERLFISKENSALFNIFRFRVDSNLDLLECVKKYSKDNNVLYAEPNYIFKTCLTPNDPDFNMQYYLHNTGQTNGTVDADIDAPEAWDIETGDENIVICIHDTGVDWDHPDLADNIWVNPGEDLNGNGIVDSSDFNDIDDDCNGYIDDIRGYDFVNTTDKVAPGEDGTDPDNNPMDFHGHGTHCSGIASASTDNNIGIAGVCWNCTIMPVKIGYKSSGGSGLIDIVAAAKGLEYAADNGAHIISMSWGGSRITFLIWDAINYSYSKGSILVAAAGNIGNGIEHYPAAYPDVIAVAATDHNDERAHTAFGSNHGSWVDVAAAGEYIYSTLFNDTYVSWSGTSMATPQVAALAALILSKNPSFSQKQVWTIIRSTTDPVNSSDKYIGIGRINAYNAIIRNYSPIADLYYELDNAIVYGNLSINGSATGSEFEKYEVYYGAGKYPDDWTMVHSSNTPVSDDTLAVWSVPDSEDEDWFSIRLLVYDSFDQISEDRVVVLSDSIPTLPVIEGPNRGEVDIEYTFFFNSTDADGDEICYYISWDDGSCEEWIGPYEPGEKIYCKHTWTSKGKYTISAKSKDIYGAESEVSTIELSIPRSKFVVNNILLRLYERFPNIFHLFRLLINY
jgi:subtilisin family serine protease